MKKSEKEKLNTVSLFISILTILNEQSMAESEVKKIIYLKKPSFYKVNDDILLSIFVKLFDGGFIEIETAGQGDNLLKITKQGKSYHQQIMALIAERTKE